MQLGRKFTQPSKQAGNQGSSIEPEVEDSKLNNGRLEQAEAIGKSLDCMRQWEDMHVSSVCVCVCVCVELHQCTGLFLVWCLINIDVLISIGKQLQNCCDDIALET